MALNTNPNYYRGIPDDEYRAKLPKLSGGFEYVEKEDEWLLAVHPLGARCYASEFGYERAVADRVVEKFQCPSCGTEHFQEFFKLDRNDKTQPNFWGPCFKTWQPVFTTL